MELLFIVVGVAVGAVVGFLAAKQKSAERIASLGAELDVQKATVEGVAVRYEEKVQAAEGLLASEKKHLEERLVEQERLFNGRIAELKEQHEHKLQELKAQQSEQMQQQMALIREQMNTASEKILHERSEQLSEKNKEQLSAILNPLREGIRQMQEAVEKSDREHAQTMVRLDETIKTSIEQSREVGERADRLAQALTGENKTQGNFGELRLKQLLQDMELVEGEQFEEQVMMKDAAGKAVCEEEEGHKMVPDVILHFPDRRDVIIDSKMSLKAFEKYHTARTDEERSEALKAHIASVRKHVDELARKNYSSYLKKGSVKLDFVLMYVFSESALQLALSNDATLWKYAYDKGVVISGSQNLYMMLRVLQMTWRQVRQVENLEQVMKAANTVVDRVQLFHDRFADVEAQLDKTRDVFDKLKVEVSPSGQSIEVAARSLLKYGAKKNPKRKYQFEEDERETLFLEDAAEDAAEDATETSPSATE